MTGIDVSNKSEHLPASPKSSNMTPTCGKSCEPSTSLNYGRGAWVQVVGRGCGYN